MNLIRNHGTRLALIASGLTMLIAGPLHPSSDAKDSAKQELATMTAADSWVLAHSLIVLSTALLACGLWLAYRQSNRPASARRAMFIAAVAISIYVVETIFHLASAVDTEALRDGDSAPVALTHMLLASVLYPVSGLAIAYLAARLFSGWTLPQKVFAVAGVAGGLLHALSVPMVLALPDTELSFMFAGAGILIAVWSVAAGVLDIRGAAGPARTSTALALS
jgi:uncharacterized membrane protein YozB (DUF420 family)